jgi:hypothetical protein
LADPDAPGVEKPQRVAGGFGKYPRPSESNVMTVVAALTNGIYSDMKHPGNVFVALPGSKSHIEETSKGRDSSSASAKVVHAAVKLRRSSSSKIRAGLLCLPDFDFSLLSF